MIMTSHETRHEKCGAIHMRCVGLYRKSELHDKTDDLSMRLNEYIDYD